MDWAFLRAQEVSGQPEWCVVQSVSLFNKKMLAPVGKAAKNGYDIRDKAEI